MLIILVWTSRPGLLVRNEHGPLHKQHAKRRLKGLSCARGSLFLYPGFDSVAVYGVPYWGSHEPLPLAAYDTNNVHEMSTSRLVHTALQRFKSLTACGVQDSDVPTDVFFTVEDELIPLLESLDDWEPSDNEMMASFGTKWHDGL